MKVLKFELKIVEKDPEKIIDRINKILNINLQPIDGDLRGRDAIWQTFTIGIELEFQAFKNGLNFFNGSYNDFFDYKNEDEEFEINDISEEMLAILKTYDEGMAWEISRSHL